MKHYKYPRTFHLPFSLGRSSDDKVLKSIEHFNGLELILSQKMDGENSTIFQTGMHARSIDGRSHPSRDWLKAFHSTIASEIPEDWRICGENLYAKHSIGYDDLPSYFMGFSIWNEKNICLSWDETVEWFDLLGIEPVPVLWRGTFDEAAIKKIASQIDTDKQEGFVLRSADSFRFEDFSKCVAKWVRPKHVQTDEHWMQSAIIPNGLKSDRNYERYSE